MVWFALLLGCPFIFGPPDFSNVESADCLLDTADTADTGAACE